MTVSYGTSVNQGNQNVGVHFRAAVAPETWNVPHSGTTPMGIYGGCTLSANGTNAVVQPGMFVFWADDVAHPGTTQYIRCSANSSTTVAVVDGDYVIARYKYQDIEGWYAAIGVETSYNSADTSEICFGRVSYNGPTMEFDYSERTGTGKHIRVNNQDLTSGYLEDKLRTIMPAGRIEPYGGVTCPTYYLVCDGDLYSINDYPELYASIGNTWGSTNATNFAVPDLRGRVIVGSGTHMDSRFISRTFTLGETDTPGISSRESYNGEYMHQITQDEMANHTHVGAFITGSLYRETQTANPFSYAPENISLNGVGNDMPHNNMQPYAAMNYIIFAGISAAGGGGTPAPVTQVLTSITISPSTYSANVAESKVYEVVAYDQFSNVMSGVSVYFSSNDYAVASVNLTPVVTAANGKSQATVVAVETGNTMINISTNVLSTNSALTVNKYLISTSFDGNGSIVPEYAKLSPGAGYTFNFFPNDSDTLLNVSVNGVSVNMQTSYNYTFNNVTANQSLHAVFSAI